MPDDPKVKEFVKSIKHLFTPAQLKRAMQELEEEEDEDIDDDKGSAG